MTGLFTAHQAGLAGGGLLVGWLVGLTGTGGGALLTPILILIFNFAAPAAVGTDLAASLFMKPVGGLVHLHHRTVRLDVVWWLSAGSVPGALLGAWVLGHVGTSSDKLFEPLLGLALVATSVGMIIRRHRSESARLAPPPLRRWSTLGIGIGGGLAVGLTSVGSGALMLVALRWLYPQLTNAELVGTDLVQAVPLVAAASLGQMLFGQVNLGVTAALLVGALPGVYVGALMSARYRGRIANGALVAVLLGSGLKMLSTI